MKNFIMKNLMKMQLKKLPEDQREKAEKMIDENPELLMKIAQEIQEEVKKGRDQMTVAMEIAKKYESELKGIK
ncbi:MAG: hypothetical protein Athens071416_96 [Parcubacteria group bacterium Athens0714_16]|nr:MAG: hypothetical protein Athens071416_96 [Parcubacteria group bacterium Athens0714_16]